MRQALVATLAIVLFGAGSLVVVYLGSRSPDASGGLAPAPPPAAPAPPAPGSRPGPLPTPAAAAPDLSRFAGRGVPPRPMEYAPTPPPPAPGSWEAVPMVARLSSLGALGIAVHGGLQDLQPRLSDCFDRPGRSGSVRTPADAAEGAVVGPTVLVLELETDTDAVRIVDAPVATRGETDDGVVGCAQQLLRGRAFASRGARAGTRHRVLHPLIQ